MMAKEQLKYSFLGIYQIWEHYDYQIYKLFGITIAKQWGFSTTPCERSFWKKTTGK